MTTSAEVGQIFKICASTPRINYLCCYEQYGSKSSRNSKRFSSTWGTNIGLQFNIDVLICQNMVVEMEIYIGPHSYGLGSWEVNIQVEVGSSRSSNYSFLSLSPSPLFLSSLKTTYLMASIHLTRPRLHFEIWTFISSSIWMTTSRFQFHAMDWFTVYSIPFLNETPTKWHLLFSLSRSSKKFISSNVS